jgi:hypothetical protein
VNTAYNISDPSGSMNGGEVPELLKFVTRILVRGVSNEIYSGVHMKLFFVLYT